MHPLSLSVCLSLSHFVAFVRFISLLYTSAFSMEYSTQRKSGILFSPVVNWFILLSRSIEIIDRRIYLRKKKMAKKWVHTHTHTNSPRFWNVPLACAMSTIATRISYANCLNPYNSKQQKSIDGIDMKNSAPLPPSPKPVTDDTEISCLSIDLTLH